MTTKPCGGALLAFAAAIAACTPAKPPGASPAASAPAPLQAPVAPDAAGAPVATHDAGPPDARPEDSDVVDVGVESIGGKVVKGHTGDLHGSFPVYAYVILVHAPSKDDIRVGYFRDTLGILFHPHDPAPSVLYVASFRDEPLVYPQGRLRHQVDRRGAEALQRRFGDFVVLVLDSRGKIRLASTEPPSREALQRAVGHHDRKESYHPRPPPHRVPRAH